VFFCFAWFCKFISGSFSLTSRKIFSLVLTFLVVGIWKFLDFHPPFVLSLSVVGIWRFLNFHELLSIYTHHLFSLSWLWVYGDFPIFMRVIMYLPAPLGADEVSGIVMAACHFCS
jgi:hypothetical protein